MAQSTPKTPPSLSKARALMDQARADGPLSREALTQLLAADIRAEVQTKARQTRERKEAALARLQDDASCKVTKLRSPATESPSEDMPSSDVRTHIRGSSARDAKYMSRIAASKVHEAEALSGSHGPRLAWTANLSSRANAHSSMSYQEHLYREGVLGRAEQLKWRDEALEVLAAHELSECTFQPAVNDKSRSLVADARAIERAAGGESAGLRLDQRIGAVLEEKRARRQELMQHVEAERRHELEKKPPPSLPPAPSKAVVARGGDTGARSAREGDTGGSGAGRVGAKGGSGGISSGGARSTAEFLEEVQRREDERRARLQRVKSNVNYARRKEGQETFAPKLNNKSRALSGPHGRVWQSMMPPSPPPNTPAAALKTKAVRELRAAGVLSQLPHHPTDALAAVTPSLAHPPFPAPSSSPQADAIRATLECNGTVCSEAGCPDNHPPAELLRSPGVGPPEPTERVQVTPSGGVPLELTPPSLPAPWPSTDSQPSCSGDTLGSDASSSRADQSAGSSPIDQSAGSPPTSEPASAFLSRVSRDCEKRRLLREGALNKAHEETRQAAAPRGLSAKSQALATQKRRRQIEEAYTLIGHDADAGDGLTRAMLRAVLAQLGLVPRVPPRPSGVLPAEREAWRDEGSIEGGGGGSTEDEDGGGGGDISDSSGPSAQACSLALDEIIWRLLATTRDPSLIGTVSTRALTQLLLEAESSTGHRPARDGGEPSGVSELWRQSASPPQSPPDEVRLSDNQRSKLTCHALRLLRHARHLPRQHAPETQRGEVPVLESQSTVQGSAAKRPAQPAGVDSSKVFDALHATADRWQQNRERRRAESAEAAMTECTFMPDLSRSAAKELGARVLKSEGNLA